MRLGGQVKNGRAPIPFEHILGERGIGDVAVFANMIQRLPELPHGVEITRIRQQVHVYGRASRANEAAYDG